MRKLGYRPALDGLRAIAIVLVVAVHAFGWPVNGALGVDLFFVLSGFLITQLLLEEHAESGHISLAAFYARRARRLLPALALLLAVYVAVAAAFGKDPALPALEAVFYCTNFVAGFLGHPNHSPISYSFYLRHAPALYLAGPLRGHRGDVPLTTAAIAASVLLAHVSTRYVERPFRTHRHPVPVAETGAGSSLPAFAVAEVSAFRAVEPTNPP